MEHLEETTVDVESKEGDSFSSSRRLRWLWESILIIVILALIVDSYYYPVSNTIFVRVIGYPTLVLSVLDILFAIRTGYKERESVAVKRKSAFWRAFTLGVAYVVLMFGIGFIAATILFISLTPFLMGARGRLVPISVLVSLILSFGFPLIFHGSGIVLPHGWLWGWI